MTALVDLIHAGSGLSHGDAGVTHRAFLATLGTFDAQNKWLAARYGYGLSRNDLLWRHYRLKSAMDKVDYVIVPNDVGGVVEEAAGLTITPTGLTTTNSFNWPFTGTEYVSTNYTPTFTKTTGKLTLVACITPTAGAAGQRIFSSETSEVDGLLLHMNAPGTQLSTWFSFPPSDRAEKNTAATLVPGTPIMAATVINEGNLDIYSTPQGLSATSADMTAITGTPTHGELRIGASADAADSGIEGSMHGPALIFDGAALTEVELDDIGRWMYQLAVPTR